MHVIRARNVNDAYYQGLTLLINNGEKQQSRAGTVLVYPMPVTTVYEQPMERVLFDPSRDANPFFHLGEALWMLCGRDDATWLDRFVGNFSSRFAEEGGIQHGAYGHRWRRAFGFDQLDKVVERLRKDPNDRQCVIQMWDCTDRYTRFGINQNSLNPDGSDHHIMDEVDCAGGQGCDDLKGQWKDRPCNTHIYLRVRQGDVDHTGDHTENVLDITVCCRSNDAVWGAYGANAVHFSVLQEYLAKRIGVGVGRYYQVSNNFHVYTEVLPKLSFGSFLNPYAEGKMMATPIVKAPVAFDVEVEQTLAAIDSRQILKCENSFLEHIALPMFKAYAQWRAKLYDDALRMLDTPELRNSDWGVAARQWFKRRKRSV